MGGEAGKGDSYRPYDQKKWDIGWAKIDWSDGKKKTKEISLRKAILETAGQIIEESRKKDRK